MIKRTISMYLRGVGFQMEVKNIKRYQIVHVNFINADGKQDETSFDVGYLGTKTGNQELADLYKDFCKENRIPANTVIGITVVASAETKEELGKIDM